MTFQLTGIDVGLRNLGVVKCVYKDNNLDIIDFKLIDLYKYKGVGSELHMLIDCFVVEYKDLFNTDYILIERQPPGGLIVIQELLAYIFKDKVKLISPRSIHSKLGINYYCYDQRKVKTIQLLYENLTHNNKTDLLLKLNNIDRKHDVADAYCIVKYFTEYVIHKKRINMGIYVEPITFEDSDIYFKSFRFDRSKRTFQMEVCQT